MSDAKINKAESAAELSAESVTVQDSSNEGQAVIDSLQELAENALDALQDSVLECSLEDKYVPTVFPKEGKPLADIKQDLLNLISRCEEEEDIISYLRPQKWMDSDVQKAALLSHTMAAYISALNKHLVDRIAAQLVSDASLWLSKMFRFFDAFAYFSRDRKEGLIRVLRMVLHLKYPRYSTSGYEVLFTRPPVIYYCDAQGFGFGKNLSYLCSQLGLPLCCVTAVPCLSTSPDGQYKMDPAILEKYIKDDLSATKTPLVVIANAGLSLLGYVDNLQRIHEICIANNVWMHIQGQMLAGLALLESPKVPVVVGDSLSLNLGKWIGFPSLPDITLYKAKDVSHIHLAGLGQTFHSQLDFLPVWVTLQAVGHSNVVQRIRLCFELGDRLLACIEKFPQLKILSKRRGPRKNVELSSVSLSAMFDTLTFVTVFQYANPVQKGQDIYQKNPPYYDNLNSWLVQLLNREVPNIRTDIIELEEFGVCLRICPLESAHVLGTTTEDVEQYLVSLQQKISILGATVAQKDKLYREHKNHRKLQLVEIADWAGMGGVRYIPEFWADRLNELTDTGKADINRLNSELVAKLKATDSAFSLGEADDGMLCVRFGMVDDNLDMEELIDQVMKGGQEIEESCKLIETMREMVKQGIEEATKELIQENQEKIMQEGVLRQVPVIGSLVSWWYPAEIEAGIKGRSFNLASGVIESTENIYKYHMQVKGSPSPPTATKVVLPSSPSPSETASVATEQNDSAATENR